MPDFTHLRRQLGLPLLLALLALAGAVYYYFAGESAVLPVQLVPHLAPVPLTLDSVAVGPVRLPLPVSGFITTLTHDVGGPYTQPLAAALWLSVLALALAGWLAVVSMLRRPAFLAGMVPVIFLLLALNADALGIFSDSRQYFLYLSLGGLGAAALGLQAFGERVRVVWRVVIFGALVAALVALIVGRTKLPLAETVLHLAAYATPASALLVVLLVLWVGLENVRALLWFNTQAERPEGRFGLLPFVVASLLYVGALGWYWWNNDTMALAGGLHLDPLVLLLPAVVASGLGLRQREPTYAGWLPFVAARPLYWLLVAAASAALGYALATANAPLLAAARSFSARALGLFGAAFFLYVLINFGGLLQQRLRVYRVVFEPRRLPFYTVYIMALATLLLIELRSGWPLATLVQAGQYNQLGDLARQQSEARPDDLPLALLAERYYAESGDVLARFNRTAQLGRAALYRFRGQRQNELNALRRALLRQPDEKISLRLNALLTEPADFLDALEVLRQARRAAPRSLALTSDLAQLFTRSALTDSVAIYLDKTERLKPNSYVSRTNQLGFLLSQNLYSAAQKLATAAPPPATEPALLANQELLQLLMAAPATPPAPIADADLDAAAFAHAYQAALLTARAAQPGPARHQVTVLAKLAERPANAPYYEQLLFLQALLRHAAGQELAARQTLAPLTVGTTAAAGYYQYVLGMWQLQQQQYATAATQLAQAQALGATDARLPRAWALVLAGQTDSAQTAYHRLAADTTQRAAVVALGRVLQRADLKNVNSKIILAGSQELASAQRAASSGQLPEATHRYQALVQQAPFNEAAVLAAARFFTQQKAYTDAYDTLNKGLAENPTSAALLQAYALAAADAGLADLGQSALDQLRPRLGAAQYATLLAQFAQRRAAHAAASAAFDQPPVPAR
ncbi:hypothetical protein QMK33_06390 [Hymenobacter sp. H14-R3]|uniref:hypothetical protein n=1 Tax=Hymenobacter sp. H14-R3 TaxID=3046308 RepID=UPI0024B8D444|nr:hypothetical protein [Hymenobacter sp. H14-R3]MDJ0364774.1 hypothetical protein [Hymenobacter sp. H14-R3]